MGKIRELFSNLKIKGDKPLWIIVLLLSLFSILVVYSSSYSEIASTGGNTTGPLVEQIVLVLLGWTAMVCCYFIPPYVYKKAAFPIFVACCALLIYALFFGATKNQTSRWVTIFFISFQPSELAKIGLVLYLGKVIENFNLDNFKTYTLTVLVPVGAMLFLILVNSVSMTVLLTIVAACLLLFNGLKGKFILRTLGIAVALLGLVWGTVTIINKNFDTDISVFKRFETASARIERFISSDDEAEEGELTKEEEEELKKDEGKEFQKEMSLIAIKSGGIFGKGPGHSTQKYILPQANSDFVYSIIIEEYGIIVGIIIMMLYILIFIRCVRIAKKCNRKFSVITVIGLGTAITLQACVHMMVNVGLMPVTGQTLPLLSSGGTSLIVMCGAFGIILSISRAADEQGLSRKKKEESLPIELVESADSGETAETAGTEAETDKEENK